MQGIYKIFNKSKNENTFYFEFYSGCTTFVCVLTCLRSSEIRYNFEKYSLYPD